MNYPPTLVTSRNALPMLLQSPPSTDHPNTAAAIFGFTNTGLKVVSISSVKPKSVKRGSERATCIPPKAATPPYSVIKSEGEGSSITGSIRNAMQYNILQFPSSPGCVQAIIRIKVLSALQCNGEMILSTEIFTSGVFVNHRWG